LARGIGGHGVTESYSDGTAALGKRVPVTGCGPIGALAIMAAHLHGARKIVATDVVAAVLQKAQRLGADRTINFADDPDQFGAYTVNKGYFDVQFEAYGNERAVRSGLEQPLLVQFCQYWLVWDW
jgi:L-idonate 5-dehydrogenase